MTIGFFSLMLVSLMLVSAGVYPVPFTNNNEANVAVVYGANAAATDSTGADSIVNSLSGSIITQEELERIFSTGVVEDEVRLGSDLDDEIRPRLTDNKIPSLFDGRIEWNDGEDTDNYNVHEEIIIGSLRIQTSLDNNDFEGVVLTNDEGLEYKLIFEEDIFEDGGRHLGSDDAEALELTILGEEYLVEEVESGSITVTNAEKLFLSEGASATVEGKTLTIDSIYENSVFINGILIKEGKKKTINGVEVKVDEIYYTSKDSAVSKVDIYAGGDISEEYSDGNAFIGQDKDDPEWVWSIENPGEKDGWIGVRYDLRQVDEEDDVVYEGGEYIFPNGVATVSFDRLTDVYFDDVDLYEIGDTNENGARHDDVEVVVIKGENDDSFLLEDDIETDTLYLQNSGDGFLKVYYMDLAEDFSTGKPVWYKDIALDSITKTLSLTNKIIDFENTPWLINGTMNATVEYTEEGPVFEAGVISSIGFVLEDYKLIYYADKADRFNNVSVAIDVADVDGSLPYAGDENAAGGSYNYTDLEGYAHANGAKLWLIPKDATNNDGEIDWGRADEFLFETDMITYKEEPFDERIADLIADETEMEVSISADGKYLFLIGDGDGSNIEISLGGDNTQLGAEKEDAEGSDVKVDGTSIGTRDNDVMDYYGTIIESPGNNADDDKVVFRVPSEQVYAQISVLGSEEDTVETNVTFVKPTPAELGIAKITDGNIASASGKNIIVVGGSCINTVAASLLGGKACGAEFTAKTGVGVGQVLIQTFDRGDGSLATVVAGYEAADTVRGVQHLLSNNFNIAVGEKVII